MSSTDQDALSNARQNLYERYGQIVDPVLACACQLDSQDSLAAHMFENEGWSRLHTRIFAQTISHAADIVIKQAHDATEIAHVVRFNNECDFLMNSPAFIDRVRTMKSIIVAYTDGSLSPDQCKKQLLAMAFDIKRQSDAQKIARTMPAAH